METGAEDFEQSVLGKFNGFLYRCKADANFTMLALTSGIERVFGYPANELLGNRLRTYASIIHQDDRDLVDKLVTESFEAKQNFDLDYRVVSATGENIWVHETGGGVWSATGELLYCEGAVTNINNLYVRIEQRTAELQSIVDRGSDIMNTLRTLRLLALNASIEAGRVGQVGSGFSVLANEMRRLAATSEEMAKGLGTNRDANVYTKKTVALQRNAYSMNRPPL